MQENPRIFKLIALRVMEECSPMLSKVLCTGETYFFCNEYEDDRQGGIRHKPGIQELAPDFFQVKGGPLVSISCIVGMNGDGKSSIIELLIRILNNFAYAAGFSADHDSLRFIPGLHARLFYKIDNRICTITCSGDSIELQEDGVIIWKRKLAEDTLWQPWYHKKIIVKYAHNLFYTLVNNYSLYAYNSEEFKLETGDINEEKSWVTALFHKNDAYQTPVVLSPMRTRGNININREYELSMQRFNELFLDCRQHKFTIGDHETVEGFMFKVETDCKLYTRTLKDYLTDPKQGARDCIVLDKALNRHRKNRNYALNLAEEKVLNENIQFWTDFDERFYDSGLLSIAKTILTEENKDSAPTDLSMYLTRMKKEAGTKKHKSALQNIRTFLRHGGGQLTFLQFQRLFLIYEVYRRWCSYNQPSIEFTPIHFQDMTLMDHAVWYLIYKTIRVIDQYQDYFSEGLNDYERPQHFFNKKVRQNNLDKWFRAIDEDLYEHRSHITLKIRQTLDYIAHYEESLLTNKDKQTNYPQSIKEALAKYGYDYYLDVKEYNRHIDPKSEFAATVPPPIFYLDYLVLRDSGGYYPFSRMSSGERQLLNTASAIAYHLKNIDRSKSTPTKIAYTNINVVLEEVELYFHPEYQRQFINYLLTQIAVAHFKRDLAINLIFVTHSPFILSDIPRQNVLFLKNGAPDRSMQEDTFGANIHTMLQSGFFLNSVPIGDFAKVKINRMFALLNQSSTISEEEMDRLYNEIPLVSEPLLRSQLMKLYHQRRGFEGKRYEDYARKIQELEQTVAELKKKLHDNN